MVDTEKEKKYQKKDTEKQIHMHSPYRLVCYILCFGVEKGVIK